VKDRQASATALLIAASLVSMERNPVYASTISTASAELAGRILKNYSPASRYFLKLLRRSWFWQVAALCERLTVPGILRHYALRKKCIAELACAGAAEGISQFVVLGAGFDGLAFELRRKFADVQAWEIDHPATQRWKASVVNSAETDGIHFVPADLSLTGVNDELLISAGFDPKQKTLWIAEGILMYFSEQTVARLLEQTRKLSAPCSGLVFTFMERDTKGRIRFRDQTKLVDWWLRRRKESFRWGIETDNLAKFISPWRVVRIYDNHDLRKMDSANGNKTLARGELICLARC
jgi:methyltransferase (TIGR00027 family)